MYLEVRVYRELITLFRNLHLPPITAFAVLGLSWQLKAYLKIKCHFSFAFLG